jgi:hypothetical protein
MPVGPPPERISPKVIFCGRIAHDFAAGSTFASRYGLGIRTVQNYKDRGCGQSLA